jgi:hypothetical protein
MSVAPGTSARRQFTNTVAIMRNTVSNIQNGNVRARIAGIAVISGLISPEYAAAMVHNPRNT